LLLLLLVGAITLSCCERPRSTLAGAPFKERARDGMKKVVRDLRAKADLLVAKAADSGDLRANAGARHPMVAQASSAVELVGKRPEVDGLAKGDHKGGDANKGHIDDAQRHHDDDQRDHDNKGDGFDKGNHGAYKENHDADKENHDADKENHGADKGEGFEKELHGYWNKHHGSGRGHYWKTVFANFSMHFLEHDLVPSVYVVLTDKGIQVNAEYEVCGNETALTKVGIQVSDIYVIVYANGNLVVDGQASNISEFTSLEFENGEIIMSHHFLTVKYGVYSVFMKIKAHGDKLCPRVGVLVGVEKSVKATPGGFLGARIAVDPANYLSLESID